MFSLGGYDQTLIQWRRAGEESDEDEGEAEDSDLEESKIVNKSKVDTSHVQSNTGEDKHQTESKVEEKKDNTIIEEESENEDDSASKQFASRNSSKNDNILSPIKMTGNNQNFDLGDSEEVE